MLRGSFEALGGLLAFVVTEGCGGNRGHPPDRCRRLAPVSWQTPSISCLVVSGPPGAGAPLKALTDEPETLFPESTHVRLLQTTSSPVLKSFPSRCLTNQPSQLHRP